MWKKSSGLNTSQRQCMPFSRLFYTKRLSEMRAPILLEAQGIKPTIFAPTIFAIFASAMPYQLRTDTVECSSPRVRESNSGSNRKTEASNWLGCWFNRDDCRTMTTTTTANQPYLNRDQLTTHLWAATVPTHHLWLNHYDHSYMAEQPNPPQSVHYYPYKTTDLSWTELSWAMSSCTAAGLHGPCLKEQWERKRC